jgi:hypothetical protein
MKILVDKYIHTMYIVGVRKRKTAKAEEKIK